MKPPTDERLLTVPQLAERWGLSTRTVRRRVRDSAVPFLRLGPHAIAFRRSDIERWEEERVKVTRPDEPGTAAGAQPAPPAVIPGWDGVVRGGKRRPRR